MLSSRCFQSPALPGLARNYAMLAELPDDGLHLENISAGGAEVTFLKLKILSGHGEFVAVYNISATAV